MIRIPVPTPVDFWHWLARLSYRKYSARQKASGQKPVGIPGNRDPSNPCTAFEPRTPMCGDWGDCDTDGHYLCQQCCHISKGKRAER